MLEKQLHDQEGNQGGRGGLGDGQRSADTRDQLGLERRDDKELSRKKKKRELIGLRREGFLKGGRDGNNQGLDDCLRSRAQNEATVSWTGSRKG